LVVKDGDIAFSQGFGVRELGESAEVSDRTLFAIGSTTKAMTAAAIGMLVDEGKLRWDDPVTKHLPTFQLHDPYVTREVTVRDLLTHRAGLGNADFLWYEKETTIDEVLDRIRHAELAYSMRSGFIYQNIMYAAAGEVIARVSGKPWAEFVQTRIFDPLGMTATVPTAAELHLQPDVAAPHYEIDGDVTVIENANVDVVGSAGSIWSSVNDMSKWIRFLLDGGVTAENDTLLSRETVAELFTPQAMVGRNEFYPTARLTNPHWMTYGLGWFQADYRGRAVEFHTGSIDGMVAIVGLIRDEGLGVCVLANLDHAELRHALMYRVFDLFDEGPPRDWSAELKELYTELRSEAEERRASVEAGRVEGTNPSVSLDRYVGSYADPLYGEVRVSASDSGLRLYYGPGLQGPLLHWHYDTFRVHWDAAWRGRSFVSFVLNAEGEPSMLEMNGARFQRQAADGEGG
jgi:CubicO group peptidase (beta-lactamase class C family)